METTKHRQYELKEWASDECPVWFATIYVAGNLNTAEMVCRKHCFPKGLCVTIKPTRYIFAGGTEDGVEIGLIQYVPFVESEHNLLAKAIELGKDIAENNYQWSFSIITNTTSHYFSRRAK